MSTTATRMPLATAERAAEEFRRFIAPMCDRVEIAGSIRRRRDTVGDVEILAIPKLVTRAVPMFEDLDGDPTVDALDQLLTDMAATSTGLRKRMDSAGRPCWGPRHKLLWWGDAPIDLYTARPETFGLAFAIRTGPAPFSHRLVTPRNMRTREGLVGLLPVHLKVKDGLRHRSDDELIPTPEEIDVWRALGLRWIEPEDRR